MSGSPKVIVITGASAGIGAELAKQLAATGNFKLALLARRKEALDDVAAQCAGHASPFVCDVTDRAAVDSTFARIVSELGTIDVLVNNAGRGISRVPSKLTTEEIDEQMKVNVHSVLHCTQAVLPLFREKKSGHVVVVNSIAGRRVFFAQRAAYAGAKHFLNALLLSFRMELRDEGLGECVTFSNVSPGIVATEFGVNCAGEDNFDSRQVDGAQSVEEVAQIIKDRAVVAREPEVYTREEHKQLIASFYSDM